jgi:protein-tyrosine-phosphatase
MRVLFVCSGNICRSPMAEAYMKHLAVRSGLDVEVDSAGLLGIRGEQASPEAIRVCEALAGVELSSHRSKAIEDVDTAGTDLFVVMTGDHRADLVRRVPHAEGRTLLIRAFETGAEPQPNGSPDLEDPIGQPWEAYRRCFETIRACVDHLAERLGRLR